MIGFKKTQFEKFIRNPRHVLAVLIVVTSLWLMLFTLQNVNVGSYSLLIQSVGFILALLWSFNQFIKNGKQDNLSRQSKTLDWLWLVLILALIIRFFANSIFPFRSQTGFEEIQTGSNAFRILLTNDLPIEFRFTNIFGSLGFLVGKSLSLQSLRIWFQIGGLLSLVILFMILKSLRINKIALIITIFLAAVNKYLVLASGIADELFVSILFLLAFVYCLIQMETKTIHKAFWASLAGLLAAILSYEYISYRIPVLVLGIWMLISVMRDKNISKKESQLTVFSFIFCWSLVALPTIAQTIKMPSSSIFFEAIVRHLGERNTFFVSDFFVQLVNNFKAIFGLIAPISTFYARNGTALYNPVYGILFFLGLLYNLLSKSAKINRAYSISILITVLSLSVFTNNNNIGRLTPVIPLLFLLSGDMLSAVISKIEILFYKFQPKSAIVYSLVNPNTRENENLPDETAKDSGSSLFNQPIHFGTTSRIIRLNTVYKRIIGFLLIGLLFVSLSSLIVTEISSLEKMAGDIEVRKEYANDEYAVCSFIGSVYRPHLNVFFVSDQGRNICSSTIPEAWYYQRQLFPVQEMTSKEFETHLFKSGDLIILAEKNAPLKMEDMKHLLKLAIESNSANSFRTKENVAGCLMAASICYGCDN